MKNRTMGQIFKDCLDQWCNTSQGMRSLTGGFINSHRPPWPRLLLASRISIAAIHDHARLLSQGYQVGWWDIKHHQASSNIQPNTAGNLIFVFKILTQIGVLSKCFVLKMEVKLEMCAKDPQPGHTWSFVGTWGAVGPEGNGETEKFADKRRPSRKIIWFQNDPKWAHISVHEEKTDLLTGIARRIRMILQLRGGHKNEGHQSW